MADTNSFKGAVSEMTQAIVEPVKDEVGQALEVGIQSITGHVPAPKDPKEEQKKQEDEAKRKAWAMNVIQRNRQFDEEMSRIRQQKQQKDQQDKQEQAQETQVKQYKLVQKQNEKARQIKESQTRSEMRKGVGG